MWGGGGGGSGGAHRLASGSISGFIIGENHSFTIVITFTSFFLFFFFLVSFSRFFYLSFWPVPTLKTVGVHVNGFEDTCAVSYFYPITSM